MTPTLIKLLFLKASLMAFFVICLTVAGQAQFKKVADLGSAIALLKNTSIDAERLALMNDLAYTYIMKPGSETTDLDSALLVLAQSLSLVRKSSDPGVRVRYMLLESQALREKGEEANGKENIAQALKIFDTYRDPALQAETLLESDQYYDIKSQANLVEKAALLRQAADLFGRAGLVQDQAHTLEVLGDIYGVQEDYHNALRVLETSLSLYQSIHQEDVHGLYDLLGSTYSVVGDNKRAIRFGLLAVQTAHRVRDTGTIVTIYNRLACSYASAQMFNDAITYFNKSLNAATNMGDTSDMILMNINIATTYRRQSKPEEAVTLLKSVERNYRISAASSRASLYRTLILSYLDYRRFDEAAIYITKLREAVAKMNGNIYGTLIKYSMATGDYKAMYKYVDSLEAFNLERNIGSGLPIIHFYRFKADSATGKYVSAIREYQLYQAMHDSLFGEKNRTEIERLNIAFETDKKEHEIGAKQLQILALEKSDRVKTDQVRRARMNRNYVIIGTLALLVLLALLYNQYRVKQKNNKDLLSKQVEINSKNTSLLQLVEEKEWLVKEIHHRVKNNLQVVMSLLNTQSDYSDNEQSFDVIREIRQRMYAMSLIHQKLYQADQIMLVNMANYIPELVDFLQDSFPDGNRIRFVLDIASIELDISQAVPVGLILNEIVTNSIKYAFPAASNATISISMRLIKNEIRLVMKDNGIGLPAGFESADGTTMGMQLVQTLAEQLRGSVELRNDDGLNVMLKFAISLPQETGDRHSG